MRCESKLSVLSQPNFITITRHKSWLDASQFNNQLNCDTRNNLNSNLLNPSQSYGYNWKIGRSFKLLYLQGLWACLHRCSAGSSRWQYCDYVGHGLRVLVMQNNSEEGWPESGERPHDWPERLATGDRPWTFHSPQQLARGSAASWRKSLPTPYRFHVVGLTGHYT